MAAMKKRKTTTTKVKKKKWHPIYAPKQFQEAQLGETYVSESTEIMNKFLTINLSTIVRSMRKQNVNIHFKVTDVKDGKGHASIIGYSLINAAIKRLVRRGRDKVSDSFLAKTNDKKLMRLKPLIITMHKGTKSIQSAIRLEARRIVREFVFSKTIEEVFESIINGQLQKLIKETVAKIAPVKNIEFRIAKIEENNKVIITDKAVESEEVKIRKKEKGEKHISEEELKAIEEAKKKEAEEQALAEAAETDNSDDGENSEDFGEEEAESEDEETVEETTESEELKEEVESEESSEEETNKSESETVEEDEKSSGKTSEEETSDKKAE